VLAWHARTLAPGEAHAYLVDLRLAEAWMKTHPAPAAAKKKPESKKCNAFAWDCVEQGGQSLIDQASEEAENLRRQARDEWKHISDEAAHDWQMAQDCLADHTQHVGDIPLRFSIAPEVALDLLHAQGSSGAASGSVNGAVSLGLPLEGDFIAHVDVFYIPCLPFAWRPKELGADGNLTAGTTLAGSVTATGDFSKSFAIPPFGGPQIPLYEIPIVIGGVPVAELDVSLYLDGTVDVDGTGNATGSFRITKKERTDFDFSCSGQGCSALRARAVPLPAQASEEGTITGLVRVKPAIYAALQLDFDVDVLSARAGPQPYLLGEAWGCGHAEAAQTQGGSSTSSGSYALFADLDWGVELRAEALAAHKKLGERKLDLVKPRHLYFWDLARAAFNVDSTALKPVWSGNLQPAAGQINAFNLHMGPCYPYRDRLEYRVRWTGPASDKVLTSTLRSGGLGVKALTNLQCTLQSSEAVCHGSPAADTAIKLGWPDTGNYMLAATPVRDEHGRVFSPPERTSQIQVRVQQQGSNTTH